MKIHHLIYALQLLIIEHPEVKDYSVAVRVGNGRDITLPILSINNNKKEIVL